MKKDLMIGLDPSFINLGVSVYQGRTKSFLAMWTGSYREISKRLFESQFIDRAYFVLENPNLDSAFYKGWDEMKKAFYKFKTSAWSIDEVEKHYRIQAKIAQDVGKNKAAAMLLIEDMIELELDYIEFAPSQRNQAKKEMKLNDILQLKMPTKLKVNQFRMLTGYQGKGLTEHNMDAATLVYDRTCKWFELQYALQRKSQLVA